MDIQKAAEIIGACEVAFRVGQLTLVYKTRVGYQSAAWIDNSFSAKTKVPEYLQVIFTGPDALKNAIDAFEKCK